MHVFCSLFTREFQESRHVQQIQLKYSPFQLNYSPDGKTILYTTTGRTVGALTFGREGEETKDQWHVSTVIDPSNGVCPVVFCPVIPRFSLAAQKALVASTVTFNHAGDGIVLTYNTESNLRILSYPSLAFLSGVPAHVAGCQTVVLDPRGRYGL